MSTVEKDSVKELRQLLKSTLETRQADLHELLQHGSLGTFAEGMFSAKLITKDLNTQPDFNKIMGSFTARMTWLKTKDKLENHCCKFLMVLEKMDIEEASQEIEKSWTENALKQLNMSLRFDSGERVRKPLQVKQGPQHAPVYQAMQHIFPPSQGTLMPHPPKRSHDLQKYFRRDSQLHQKLAAKAAQNQKQQVNTKFTELWLQEATPTNISPNYHLFLNYHYPPQVVSPTNNENDEYSCSETSQSTEDDTKVSWLSQQRNLSPNSSFRGDVLVTPNENIPNIYHTDPHIMTRDGGSGQISDHYIDPYSDYIPGSEVNEPPTRYDSLPTHYNDSLPTHYNDSPPTRYDSPLPTHYNDPPPPTHYNDSPPTRYDSPPPTRYNDSPPTRSSSDDTIVPMEHTSLVGNGSNVPHPLLAGRLPQCLSLSHERPHPSNKSLITSSPTGNKRLDNPDEYLSPTSGQPVRKQSTQKPAPPRPHPQEGAHPQEGTHPPHTFISNRSNSEDRSIHSLDTRPLPLDAITPHLQDTSVEEDEGESEDHVEMVSGSSHTPASMATIAELRRIQTRLTQLETDRNSQRTCCSHLREEIHQKEICLTALKSELRERDTQLKEKIAQLQTIKVEKDSQLQVVRREKDTQLLELKIAFCVMFLLFIVAVVVAMVMTTKMAIPLPVPNMHLPVHPTPY